MGIRGRSGEEDKRREWGGGDCVLFFLSQKQDRYKVLQGLVDHLDTEIDIKEGLLTTLSNCVTVGADGSIGLPPPPPPLHRPACTSLCGVSFPLGPFVLEVFQTLIRHLKAMCSSGVSVCWWVWSFPLWVWCPFPVRVCAHARALVLCSVKQSGDELDRFFFYTEVLPGCNDTPICGLHAHIWACPKAQGYLYAY